MPVHVIAEDGAGGPRRAGRRLKDGTTRARRGAGRRLAAFALLPLLLAVAVADARAASTPIPSSGCRGQPPQSPPGSVVVDGVERAMIIAVSDSGAAPGGRHDLVVAFHGRTSSNAEARRYYDLERHAARPTVFVYPAGLPAVDGGRSWSDAGDASGALRDFALFDAIVRRMARSYCLDLGRVFAVGHSLGASFVGELACSRGSMLRGIAIVAGAITAPSCSNAFAALLLHNPNDEVVPISLAESARDRLLAANRISGAPQPLRSGDLNCVWYGAEDALNPVVWCPHRRDYTARQRYYPHQWPEGASRLIMAFFDALD